MTMCSVAVLRHIMCVGLVITALSLSTAGVTTPWWRSVDRDVTGSYYEGLWHQCVRFNNRDTRCHATLRLSGLWRAAQILLVMSLVFLTLAFICVVYDVISPSHRRHDWGWAQKCHSSFVATLFGGLTGLLGNLLYMGYMKQESQQPGEIPFFWSFGWSLGGSCLALFTCIIMRATLECLDMPSDHPSDQSSSDRSASTPRLYWRDNPLLKPDWDPEKPFWFHGGGRGDRGGRGGHGGARLGWARPRVGVSWSDKGRSSRRDPYLWNDGPFTISRSCREPDPLLFGNSRREIHAGYEQYSGVYPETSGTRSVYNGAYKSRAFPLLVNERSSGYSSRSTPESTVNGIVNGMDSGLSSDAEEALRAMHSTEQEAMIQTNHQADPRSQSNGIVEVTHIDPGAEVSAQVLSGSRPNTQDEIWPEFLAGLSSQSCVEVADSPASSTLRDKPQRHVQFQEGTGSIDQPSENHHDSEELALVPPFTSPQPDIPMSPSVSVLEGDPSTRRIQMERIPSKIPSMPTKRSPGQRIPASRISVSRIPRHHYVEGRRETSSMKDATQAGYSFQPQSPPLSRPRPRPPSGRRPSVVLHGKRQGLGGRWYGAWTRQPGHRRMVVKARQDPRHDRLDVF